MDKFYISAKLRQAMDEKRTLHEIKETVRCHCEERDWDQFHGAKDLAIGIVTEASEVIEHFRFKSYEEIEKMFKDPIKKEKIGEEMADVLFFLTRLAQKYNINLAKAFDDKMKKNREKYPVEKSKGSNKKYTEF